MGNTCHEVDALEHPYIRDDEAAALEVVRESVPAAVTSWYYLPSIVQTPMLVVSDL
jgi:hypothetical protein